MSPLAGGVDEQKPKNLKQSSPLDAEAELEPNAEVEDFFHRLMEKNEMRRPKPSPEAIAAALQAMQRLGVSGGDEEPVQQTEAGGEGASIGAACPVCGYANQPGNHFCGMCGRSFQGTNHSGLPQSLPEEEASDHPRGPHHYHHHYHHHYFDGVQGAGLLSAALGQRPPVAPGKEVVKVRTPQGGPALSRTEAALRQMTQDWALACNNKQLDDLLEFYSTDALVLRPNLPPIRGTTAIREFFFAALDSGLGDLEVEPLRVELLGDVAYEAGRCKMLVPVAVGKRREERGKYVVVFAKQKTGEWKAVVDSWSTDLTLVPGDAPLIKATPAQPPRR
jgi:ketosteroid isomerase-like protein